MKKFFALGTFGLLVAASVAFASFSAETPTAAPCDCCEVCVCDDCLCELEDCLCDFEGDCVCVPATVK